MKKRIIITTICGFLTAIFCIIVDIETSLASNVAEQLPYPAIGEIMGLSGFLKRKTTIKGHCLSMEASCARMGPRVARRSTGGFHAAHTAHIEADKAV